jgi:hypothetical protein
VTSDNADPRGTLLGPVACRDEKHLHTRSRICDQPTSGQVGRPFPLRGIPGFDRHRAGIAG